jgi:hypothetical protein
VALGTRVAEIPLDMARARRLREVAGMTRVTVGVVELVIAVLVALGTDNGRMRSSQLEGRAGVIECCRSPCIRGMAADACMTESTLHMVRVRSLSK